MHDTPPMDTETIHSFAKKVECLQKTFEALKTPAQKYEQIIGLGKKLPPIHPKHKTIENLVRGCQSDLYIHAEQREGGIFFRRS